MDRKRGISDHYDEEKYVLIGTEVSLFTTKVRAYLDWKGVKYERMLPSDSVYKTLILPMTSIAMIPVLLVSTPQQDDRTKQYAIQDSKDIMDFFENKYAGPELSSTLSIIPQTPKRCFVAMLLEIIADEWLLLQAMYWRWSPKCLEKQQAFLEYEFGESASGGKGSFEEKIAIGRTRTRKFAAFCPGLGITPETSPVIEKQFKHLLTLLSAHLEYNKFLLGNGPTVADFAFYGSFYAHLSRDPVPGFIIKTEAPLVAAWIERITLTRSKTYMKELPDDKIPNTLLPLVEFFLADFIPVLSTVVDRTLAFLAVTPTKQIPRRLGITKFTLSLRGQVLAEETRGVSSHGIWMLQRILDRAYTRTSRADCDALLGVVGGQNSDITQQWCELVQKWEGSGYKIVRDRQNQLVAQDSSKPQL